MRKFVGGTPEEIIDALLHALELNGITKNPGTGWTVDTEYGRSQHAQLCDALKHRIQNTTPYSDDEWDKIAHAARRSMPTAEGDRRQLRLWMREAVRK